MRIGFAGRLLAVERCWVTRAVGFMSSRKSIVRTMTVVGLAALSFSVITAVRARHGFASGSTVSIDTPSKSELLVDRPPASSLPTEPPPPSAGPVHVARWKGNKRAALSFTFDDGIADQATLAAPMLEAEGFRGTFFICPARAERAQNPPPTTSPSSVDPSLSAPLYANWDQWRQVAARGHEIGSHTWDHYPLDQIESRTRLKEEIVRSCQVIEQQIGEPCVSFSYPFNIESPESRVLVRHTYPFAVGGERVWYGGRHFRAVTGNQALDQTIATGGWQVAMIHAIEHGYGAFHSRDILQQHLNYVKAHTGDVWVDTLGTIGRYRREVRLVQLQLLAHDERSVRFVLTAQSKNAPGDSPELDVPITIAIDAPGATRASAGRSADRPDQSDPIPLTVHHDQILIDLRPAPESVDVTWN